MALYCGLILWAGICAVWIGLLIAQFAVRRDGLALDPASARLRTALSETPDQESVCIVIPARNEEQTIAACLEAVLAQNWSRLSVVMVDDRSEDRTPLVARHIADRDERLRIERIDELPPGWMAKSHALWKATRDVTTDWLLFIDADCRLHPEAVPALVHEARHREADLLTVWPRQQPGSFWEHMTIPLCAGIIALWYGRRQVNDPEASIAFANGQCLLFRRTAYERIGGHQSVRRSLIEDIPLAEQAKQAGLRCWVAVGTQVISVRMYDSYAAIRDGWARIYVGALRSGVKIALSILWLLFGSLLPFAVLGALVAGWPDLVGGIADGVTPARIALALSLFHLLLIAVVSYRFWGLGDCRRVYLWLYPVSVIVVVRILARAWWWLVVRRSIPWRNTRYRIDDNAMVLD